MEAWVQSIFMGDILFTEDSQYVVSMTVAGPTTYDVTVDIGAGSWFASPLHLWQHAVYVWNLNIPGGQMSATLDGDPTSATFGKVLIQPDTGLGTITALEFTWPSSIYQAMGQISTSWDLGGPTAQYTDNPISPIFGPLWPLVSMSRAGDNLTGYSDRAVDGTVYSIAGGFQETVDLAVTLDRGDYQEIHNWVGLFTDRLSRGRSVAFYLDSSDLPTEFSYELTGAQALTLISNINSLDFSRTVDYKEVQDTSRSITFGVRPSGDLSAQIL